MNTYDFLTLDGEHLATITTAAPDDEITDLALDHYEHPENIFYEVIED